MVKAIIFDLDGTIIDSEKNHISSILKTLKKYNIKASDEDIEKCRGMSMENIYKYIIKKYPQIKENVSDLVEQKTKIFLDEELDNIKIVPGFKELVDYSRDKYLLGLVTSFNSKHQKAVFEKFNLNSVFNVVITSCDSRKTKPNAEPYRRAIKKLGILPSKCVVLEDSANGITSANMAGTKTIGIATHGNTESLKRAIFVVKNLKEVIPILKENKI